jgi:hypothetical protein
MEPVVLLDAAGRPSVDGDDARPPSVEEIVLGMRVAAIARMACGYAG